MKRPSKQITSIGVIAVIVGLIAGGISSFTMAGVNPIIVFLGFFLLILVIGIVLDRAAQNALNGRR